MTDCLSIILPSTLLPPHYCCISIIFWTSGTFFICSSCALGIRYCGCCNIENTEFTSETQT